MVKLIESVYMVIMKSSMIYQGEFSNKTINKIKQKVTPTRLQKHANFSTNGYLHFELNIDAIMTKITGVY